MAKKQPKKRLMRADRIVLRQVLSETRFGQFTLAFLGVFLTCSVIIWLTGENGETFFDGIWFSFQVVSTIGFGDITTTHVVARIVAMVLSVISIFYIAILTGVIVNFFNHAIKMQQENTLASYAVRLESLKENVPDASAEKITEIIDKLTHLEDLSQEELDELRYEIMQSQAAASKKRGGKKADA